MSDLEVVSFRPEPGQYAWTFGGAAPVRRIRTPAVLEVFTEDCFGGRPPSGSYLATSEQFLVAVVSRHRTSRSGRPCVLIETRPKAGQVDYVHAAGP
jgi:hypothetical protein